MFATNRHVSAPETGDDRDSGRRWRQSDIHSTKDALALLDAVTVALVTAGFSKKELFEFRLALEEAIINAIKHGHQYDGAKRVRVAYDVSPERALAEVEDEGPGFDPEQVPDPTAPENLERPCGRGLFLIRAYMSWVRFNESGNRLTFCKIRSVA